jgi:alpha-L-rhamnosidase
MRANQLVCLAGVLALSVAQDAPSGLLCDYQRDPALGVRAAPYFTWIVPPCGSPDQSQIAYRIVVQAVVGGATVWDSGKVFSNESTYVPYAGPALGASTKYTWAVQTWTQACQSPASAPAVFVTAPWGGWSRECLFMSPSAPFRGP